MKQVNVLKSITYEKAAELVLYGRQLIQQAGKPFRDVLEACKENHDLFKKQPKYTNPQNMLWAELKAQCATVVKFHDVKTLDPKTAETLDELYDYYQSKHQLITDEGACCEIMVGEPKTRSLGQFLTDVFSPKKRSDANRYTRSQGYTYDA